RTAHVPAAAFGGGARHRGRLVAADLDRAGRPAAVQLGTEHGEQVRRNRRGELACILEIAGRRRDLRRGRRGTASEQQRGERGHGTGYGVLHSGPPPRLRRWLCPVLGAAHIARVYSQGGGCRAYPQGDADPQKRFAPAWPARRIRTGRRRTYWPNWRAPRRWPPRPPSPPPP